MKYHGDRQMAESEENDWKQEQGFAEPTEFPDERLCFHGISMSENCPDCFFESLELELGPISIIPDPTIDLSIGSEHEEKPQQEEQASDPTVSD